MSVLSHTKIFTGGELSRSGVAACVKSKRFFHTLAKVSSAGSASR